MIDVIRQIAGIAGAITTIFGCSILFIKPIRNYVVKSIKKRMKDDQQDNLMLEILDTLNEHIKQDQLRQEIYELHTEALLALLRSNITRMYYKYINSDGIPSHERENLIKQYDIYHKMHGNSYVDIVYADLLDVQILK